MQSFLQKNAVRMRISLGFSVCLILLIKPIGYYAWKNLTSLYVIDHYSGNHSSLLSGYFVQYKEIIEPRISRYPYFAGYTAYRESNFSEAINYFSLIKYPNSLVYWLTGEAYQKLGNKPEAIAYLKRSGVYSLLLIRGQNAYNILDYKTACGYYLRALEINTEKPEVQMYAGHCFSRQGKFDLAEEAYKKAIELDPNFGYPYIHLANLYRDRLTRPDKAGEILRLCVQQVGSDLWRNECQNVLDPLVRPD